MVAGYLAVVNKGNQEKHIPGTNNYIQEEKKGNIKSILRITLEETQTLLDEFAGTGSIVVGGKGTKEIIDFKRVIGDWYDMHGTKKFYPTTVGIIHYGKKGAHIVPTRPVDFKGEDAP